MLDQFRHGTRILGEAHPCAKLTYEAADAIRMRNALGEGAGALAREHGVSKKAVQNLLHGKTWVRIPPPTAEECRQAEEEARDLVPQRVPA